MKILEQINKYLILAVIFIYPLFFLPIFPERFDVSKLLLLVISVLTIATIKISVALMRGGFRIMISKLDLLTLGLVTIYLISGILASPDKVSAFFYPGVASFIFFGSIFYFFVNQFNFEDKRLVNISLALSASIFGIVQLLSFTNYIKGNFTTFGSHISSLVFLLIVLSISTFQIFKERKIELKVLFGVVTFIIFISSFTSLYSLLPGKTNTPNLPSITSSWSIAIDSIKQSPFLGIGPANFIYGYNKFRPLTSNMNESWNNRYLVASNTQFTILSEVGIIGFILFLGLFALSLNKLKDINQYKIAILIVLVLSFIYPFSASLMPILFIIFALNNQTHEVNGAFNSKIPLFLIFLPFLGLVIITIFISYKAFYGEYLFGNTIKLISKNEVLSAYQTLNKTIVINPYVARYHQTSAEINLALAQNLSKKENLTEDDKKTIANLVQLSIQEGKAAISLNPVSSFSWENLGNIYINISSFSKEANKFAIEAYNQAIFLDPINPLLRIKLGGIYHAEGKYEEAVKIFELAVLAKPDFANAHYNLAMAYKGNKQIDKAKEQLELVLKLVEPNSNDYNLAKSELDIISTTPTIESQVN